MDSRAHIRYPLKLPVEFSWLDAYGCRHSSIGETSELSLQGMYIIHTDIAPPVGAKVEVSALMPAVLNKTRQTYMRGTGIVIRDDGPETGFAIDGSFRIEADAQPVMEPSMPARRLTNHGRKHAANHASDEVAVPVMKRKN